ncbi:aspartate aminotransferase family protein [Hahella sp. CCB-MM4]|uniref:aspartate aminotransferase family protein n=1 Tax=Hahella sp. (strain CCB-MM4) TaxID=1926491 RepID=UPI000B9B6A19|nr:aspartate aminotransferase family protein [Hahella sp. CCB-MM4]OZG74456.1 aspartate aminotransferase family protein [Hahella sp. CCB-MM4]
MSHVFHRQCRSPLPVAVSGQGPYIVDSTGKQYLDGCGGAAVSSLGHSHPRVLAAIKQQIEAIPFAHTGFFTNAAAEELADLLAESAPGHLNHVYFTSGGSESMEAALKLARQYFLEKGQSSKRYFIARRQSYHGNTLGALGVGGNQWRRAPYEPLMAPANLIAPCYAYRDRWNDESEWEYGQRVAEELSSVIAEQGAENILAFVAEPVVGATAGAVPAVPGYFKRVGEICRQHDILLILDEVMCGMGRTGTLFACEQDDVVPDMIAIAKGLGAGYQPIGALMVSDGIYDAIAEGTGYFQNGHTYMGHPTACAAALAVQKVIREDGLLEQVNGLSGQLFPLLHERFGSHPLVGDIRGRGLFIGLEMVRDRITKAPLPETTLMHKLIKAFALEEGLMCYPMAGTIDGRLGHHVLLAPPFILNTSQLEELVDKLYVAVDRASQAIQPMLYQEAV